MFLNQLLLKKRVMRFTLFVLDSKTDIVVKRFIRLTKMFHKIRIILNRREII